MGTAGICCLYGGPLVKPCNSSPRREGRGKCQKCGEGLAWINASPETPCAVEDPCVIHGMIRVGDAVGPP